MPKKTERGTVWDFSTSILSQNSKKLKGSLWGIFSENVSQWRKKLKGGRLVSSGIVCYTRNLFGCSLGQRVQFGVFLKFCRTFGRTILVTSGVSKKTLTKDMTIVDSFLQKSPD